MASYIGIIHKQEGSDYGVHFPDFPGCITAASSFEEVYAMAKEALQLHIDGMAEDGERIPSPMSFEEARKHESTNELLFTIMIEATVPGRPRRINIMLDDRLIQQIDEVTDNRSAFLTEAAIKALTGRNPADGKIVVRKYIGSTKRRAARAVQKVS